MKKLLFFCFCFITSNLFFGQEKALLKLLNQELKREVKNQFKSDAFEGDTLSIVESFSINDDKILSFKVKKRSNSEDGYQLIKQEVPLKMVRKIAKDIQIILETEPESVRTTYTNISSNHTETVNDNLFFLNLSNEKKNENFGLQLQSAFKNAGYFVEKDLWYD